MGGSLSSDPIYRVLNAWLEGANIITQDFLQILATLQCSKTIVKKNTLVQVKSCLYDVHSQILVGGLGVGFECGVGQVGSGVGDVSWHRNGGEWHGGAVELNFSTLPEDRDVSNPFPGPETNSLPSQSEDTQRNCPVSPIPKAQAEPTRFWALLTLKLSSFLHP